MQLIEPPSSPRPAFVLTPSHHAKRPHLGALLSLPKLSGGKQETEPVLHNTCSPSTVGRSRISRAPKFWKSAVIDVELSPPPRSLLSSFNAPTSLWVPSGATPGKSHSIVRKPALLAAVDEAEVHRRRKGADAIWAKAGAPESRRPQHFAGRGLSIGAKAAPAVWSP
jgi:hypothetical protein